MIVHFCEYLREMKVWHASSVPFPQFILWNLVSGSGAILGADLPGRTIIGENNVIGNYAVVGVKCQDLKYKVSNNLILVYWCHKV
jgi:hypothetical protein